MKTGLKSLTALFGMFWMSPINAEQITMTAIFPATFSEAAKIKRLTIRPFTGSSGFAFSRAVQSVLLKPDVNNAPYFTLAVIGGNGLSRASAYIDGSASVSTSEEGFERELTECSAYKGLKCIESSTRSVRCTMRSVIGTFDFRITKILSRDIIYSASKQGKDQISWCDGQVPEKGVEESVVALSHQAAEDIRQEISPHSENYVVRVMESAEGVTKPSLKQFKELIRLSQNDIVHSCIGWMKMAVEEKGSASLTYNIGVCAELEGDYATAERQYLLAQDSFRSGKKEVAASISRASRLKLSRQQVDNQFQSQKASVEGPPARPNKAPRARRR